MSYEQLFSRRTQGVRLGLESVREAHAALGHPGRGIDAVHVVGTNGKGSVAAMVEHALRKRGHRVGLYTSPHLMRVTERIRIDGQEVSDATLTAAIDRVFEVEAGIRLERPLSFFEVITLAGLQIMASADLDVVVAEAGLGGRLDATRLVDARVVAITPIDLDHQIWLGDTLEAVASEKAAVLREGVPGICAPQAPEVWAVLRAHARLVGATLVGVDPVARAPEGLSGAHQRVNAAVALHAARRIDTSVHLEDLDGVRWPGRLEWIPRGSGGVLLDAAHNPAGIDALARHLRSIAWLPEATIVFGCAPDKDARAMLGCLRRLRRPIWWVPPSACEEAAPIPAAAQSAARTFGGWDDPRLHEAMGARLERGGRLVVCGSHMLVGPLRERWVGHGGAPDPTDPRARATRVQPSQRG